MSEVTLNILDAQRAIHGAIHGSCADRAVAALSAEPETIEELEAAVARFIKPTGEHGLFGFFRAGVCEQPWDAGIVLIDLAARVVMAESTYSLPAREGCVQYHDGTGATDVWIYYQLPDDWKFADWSEDSWRSLTERRRKERAATPPLDAREVLYGKVTEFIVKECLSARDAGIEDPISDIHARWLMTPRDDLRGQSPREVLLAKQNFIDLDLQWRANQWSFVGECPPGLSPDSAAYRFGGFGTHENVVYYDLVRTLLHACWERVTQEKDVTAESEVVRLERLKEEWLYAPQKDYDGMTPFYVIARERERLPMAVSKEHMHVDDDCPVCQMMREGEFGPMFWNLDGSHMDWDFAFSFYQTREEWEEEMRSWDELSRKMEQERAAAPPPIWQRSFSDWDSLESLSSPEAILLALFGIAGHIAELGLDLKNVPEGERWAESLERDFAHLRDALRDDTAGLAAVYLRRLDEDLSAIAQNTPDLADKCADLQSQLQRLGELLDVTE